MTPRSGPRRPARPASFSTATAPSRTPCRPTTRRGPPCSAGTASRFPNRGSTRWAACRPPASFACSQRTRAWTVTDVDAMVQEKEQAFLTHLDAVTLIEPVIAIAAAHRGKLPIAVASGGYRDTVTRTLDRLGHPRLVRRDGGGRGHAAAQAGAGRLPGSRSAARASRPQVRGVRGHRHRPGSRPPRGHGGRGRSGMEERSG